ncbi:MAG: hypothetical protein KAX40_02310 [Herpetosiphon sp.]|nr:hypothetical protein [Herpetosiphon sp.]
MKKLLILIVTALLLFGCSTPSSPNPTSISESPPITTKSEQPTITIMPTAETHDIQPTESLPPTSTVSQVIQTQPPHSDQPTSEIKLPTQTGSEQEQVVVWEGITVTIPPNHVWSFKTNDGTIAPVYYDLPVVATAAIEPPLPANTQNQPVIERPNPTTFTMMDTTTTLDQWLKLEANNPASKAGNIINPDTLQKYTVSGKPAIRYQRMVTGVSNGGFGVIKIADNRLLLITSDNVDEINELFTTMVIP